jgi:DNA polymerase-1
VLADASVPKVGSDLKRALHALDAAGLPLEGLAFDTHVASYLCDPTRDHSLEALARDVLGVELPTLAADGARGRGRVRPESLSPAEVANALEPAVATLYPIAAALRAQLESREQWPLYERLEHPLVAVLADMERAGILVDRDVLGEQARRAGEEIARLEAELYTLAGGPLNLNSGPQLSKLLFETFGLKTGRRTKTGFSTDQAVLEELAAEHPFPKLLLEYRVLAKLKSTYLDALPAEVDPRDGRIHTTYEQAGATTGRLSSSQPNLQNIPMRTTQGREIRRAFVAAPGSVLVGADYSQIELRVMAHLSGDPGLLEAFSRGEDVHASTARRVFGITGDPDPTLRARAKIVNFGVMYGMGPRSLSQQMGISLGEAQEFIQHYFQAFARVREFIERQIEDARQRGYASTLFGRRLHLPDLASSNGAARAFAERVAVNMPIQGSAADLMKLAMIRVHGALKGSVPSARLLLQVHDELLVEAPEADAEAAGRLMRWEMERCFPLRVPLEVSVGTGRSWLDVHT